MPNKSDSIAKLAMALSKLQSEVTDVTKDKKGYGYNYADLSSVLDIARPLCAKNELAVSQLCVSDPAYPSLAGVETLLTHSSGEWISSTMYMPVEPRKGFSLAQCAGVVITYCRRYALAAILGITQTDNDASANYVEVKEPETLTPYGELVALIKAKNISPAQCHEWCDKYMVEKLSELSNEQIKEILGSING